jgi:hypothetical protein
MLLAPSRNGTLSQMAPVPNPGIGEIGEPFCDQTWLIDQGESQQPMQIDRYSRRAGQISAAE